MQKHTRIMALAPIWKDHYVTLGNGDYYDYELRLDTAAGARIFSGRAYKRPGDADVTVRINDIVADYLAQALPNLAPAGFTSFALAATVLTITGGITKDTTTFFNDWSYDTDFNPATMPLADPVLAELDPRQHLIFSTLPASSLTATLHYADGTTGTVVIQIARSADFNNDFNADFSLQETSASGGAAVLDLSQFDGLVAVTIGGMTYRVSDGPCHEWAVYYVNAYGGWDSLLLGGTTVRRDALVRHTTLQDYDNRDATARGRKDYAIEVTPAWTLRTDLLTDDQSSRMHHLLNSPEVYLSELATGKVWPVVLTDGGADRQTFKSNGHRPNQYTFNAELAQERYRR